LAARGRGGETLVGAGRMPGQHDAPIAAFTNEGEDRPDVLDAVDEALVGRPGHSPTAAGDDVVAARVELEVADGGGVELRRELPGQRRPRGENRAEPVHQ